MGIEALSSCLSPARGVAAALVFGLAGVGLAEAGQGSGSGGAPIVYAARGATPASASPQAEPTAQARIIRPATGRARIEFRYPAMPPESGSGQARAADPRVSDRPADPPGNAMPEPIRVAASTHTAPRVQPDRSSAVSEAPLAAPPQASEQAGAEARAVLGDEARRYSNPGETIRPAAVASYEETGLASWYGPGFDGKPTANGEMFDARALTAAHPTLPLPSLVQVVNLENDREVVVRVNDRGPFVADRLVDVSEAAAERLGFRDAGEVRVRLRYLGPAPVVPGGAAQAQPAASDFVSTSARLQPVAQSGDVTMASTRSSRSARASEMAIEQSAGPVQPIRETTSDGRYYVQLGAFSNIANAESLSRKVTGTHTVRIREARIDGADFFRVWVGPVSSEAAAARLRDTLAERGHDRGLIVDAATD